jgi:hypothetical protein
MVRCLGSETCTHRKHWLEMLEHSLQVGVSDIRQIRSLSQSNYSAASWWGQMGCYLSYGWMNVADGFAYLNGKKLEVLLLLQPRLTTLIQVFNRGKRFKLRHVHCAKAQLTEV